MLQTMQTARIWGERGQRAAAVGEGFARAGVHESGQVSVALDVPSASSREQRGGFDPVARVTANTTTPSWVSAGPAPSALSMHTRAAIDGFISDQLTWAGRWRSSVRAVTRTRGASCSRRALATPSRSRGFNFWPRGGSRTSEIEQDSELALTGEAMSWPPQPSWGILFGLTLDLTVAG